jgi:hypothetical protein
MASHFRSSITDKLGASLPTPLLHRVWDNVGQAVTGANAAPGARPYAARIAAAAKDSFVGGLHLIGLVAAAVTLLAAIGVAVFLPARAQETAVEPGVEPPAAAEAERATV